MKVSGFGDSDNISCVGEFKALKPTVGFCKFVTLNVLLLGTWILASDCSASHKFVQNMKGKGVMDPPSQGRIQRAEKRTWTPDSSPAICLNCSVGF